MAAVSIEDIHSVVRKLVPLNTPFVIVGGCALAFVVEDAYRYIVRPTLDVDIVVRIATRLAYSDLDTRLRDLGFRNDTRPGAPRCRWVVDSIAVDVMPTSPGAAEFGSPWFEGALTTAEEFRTNDGERFLVISAPYLLVTKLDAFLSRGEGDYYGSRDLEDIIILLEGCPSLLSLLAESAPELRRCVGASVRQLLAVRAFTEAVRANVSQPSQPQVAERALEVAHELSALG